jgi:hypothetical protein
MDKQFFQDWQTIMAAIRHWLSGGDPYGPYLNFLGQTTHAGAFSYPPPALLLGGPLAVLPWQISGILMSLLSVISFEYWVRRTTGRIGLWWLVLWLPFCQGIWLGQVTLLSLVSLVLADLAYQEESDGRCGLLLALALIKPQTLILPAVWILVNGLRQRRWRMIITFFIVTAALWGGIALVAGPNIYVQWIEGLRNYGPGLPRRSLLLPPLGFVIASLSLLLWWKHGRGDMWGLLLLLNTLLYPMAISYVAVGVAFVVIRWRHDWVWYPLVLSWIIPAFIMFERTTTGVTGLTQAIVAGGVLAGLCPSIIRLISISFMSKCLLRIV